MGARLEWTWVLFGCASHLTLDTSVLQCHLRDHLQATGKRKSGMRMGVRSVECPELRGIATANPSAHSSHPLRRQRAKETYRAPPSVSQSSMQHRPKAALRIQQKSSGRSATNRSQTLQHGDLSIARPSPISLPLPPL